MEGLDGSACALLLAKGKERLQDVLFLEWLLDTVITFSFRKSTLQPVTSSN